MFASIYPEWERVFELDERVGYRLKPNRRIRIKLVEDHKPYWLITDSQGFRNSREYPQADIVAVGDSMTEGYGVPGEFTYVRQLEQMSGVSVANLGLRGIRLAQKIPVLEIYGLAKRPRIALLQYLDDIASADWKTGQPVEELVPGYIPKMVRQAREESVVLRTPEGLREAGLLFEDPETLSRLRTGSVFYRWWYAVTSHLVSYALMKAVGRQLLDSFPPLATQVGRQNRLESKPTAFSINGHTVRLTVDPLPNARLEEFARWSLARLRHHPDWPRFKKALLELRERGARQGTSLALVVIPDSFMLYLPLIADQLPSSQVLTVAVQNVDNHPRLLAPFCAAHGIIFVDTTPALRAAARRGEPIGFPVDDHWNIDGHRVIAQEIYRVLKENHFFT